MTLLLHLLIIYYIQCNWHLTLIPLIRMPLFLKQQAHFFVELTRISNTESWATPACWVKMQNGERSVFSSKLLRWSRKEGDLPMLHFCYLFLRLDLVCPRLALDSLSSWGWTRTADPPVSPKCWDDRVCPHSCCCLSSVLGTGPRDLSMLSALPTEILSRPFPSIVGMICSSE